MKSSRRKILFATAWVVALVVVGVGVAIGAPSGGAESTSIKVSGSAIAERPVGTALISSNWGTAPGEFGRDQGGMQLGPTELAVSPDSSLIAILDNVNSRVELFKTDGTFETAVPISEGPALADVVFDGAGRLAVLSWNGSPAVLRIDPNNLTNPEKHPVAAGLYPQELVADGAHIRVRGVGDITYEVLGPDRAIEPTQQPSTAIVGTPAGDNTFQAIWKDRTNITCVLKNAKTNAAKDVEIISTDLPIDEVRFLGTDALGNFYAMARIYQEGWDGTESWWFFGLTPDGTCLGQLRLPLDYYAGGGWAVTPDGSLLELSSTKSGIQVTKYELEGQK